MSKNPKISFATHKFSGQITKIILLSLVVLIITQVFYLFSFFRYMEKNIKEGNEVVANSVAVSVGAMFDDVKASSEAFAVNETVGEFMTEKELYKRYVAYRKLNDLTQLVCNYNEDVLNIMLITDELNPYALKSSIENVLSRKIYDRFEKMDDLLDGKKELFFATNKTRTNSSNEFEIAVYRTPIYIKNDDLGYSYYETGSMIFEMNTEGIYKIIESSQRNSDIIITISDQYGNEISIGDNQKEYVKYINAEAQLKDYEICINVSQPMKYFNEDSKFFTAWLTINILVFAAMIILITIIVYIRITKPIDNMLHQIQQLHVGTKKKYIEVEKYEVVSVIADEINILMDKNREQARSILNTQRSLFEAEISEKEAQFHALQLQINPHFLYNTLSCIKAKALIHECRDIADMTNSMAKIFRYSVQQEKYVLVEREVSFIKEYFKIMAVRNEDKYVYEIDVDDGLNEYQTLKMILQPMIENAIIHGLDNRLGEGFVKIQIKNEDDNLVFRIIDNGVGFTEERLNEILRALEDEDAIEIGNSIGLINVHRRIRDNFPGGKYGVTICRDGDLTIVELVQPILEYEL